MWSFSHVKLKCLLLGMIVEEDVGLTAAHVPDHMTDIEDHDHVVNQAEAGVEAPVKAQDHK